MDATPPFIPSFTVDLRSCGLFVGVLWSQGVARQTFAPVLVASCTVLVEAPELAVAESRPYRS